MQYLSSMGMGTIGTVRCNRLGNCPLKTTDLKKSERGDMEYTYDSTGRIAVVKWNDNAVVTTVSNFVGDSPLNQARRWSKSKSAYITIQQPHMIKLYNTSMGGTDF